MVRYYFNVDGEYPFEKKMSFDASGSRLKAYGAPQPTAQIVSDLKLTPLSAIGRSLASPFPG
ncbi:MAG: hypothetical protein QOJ27_80 [Sphingomonadales bacterium]|nr:hypothetical protein [Sphingomonadales bacterium]